MAALFAAFVVAVTLLLEPFSASAQLVSPANSTWLNVLTSVSTDNFHGVNVTPSAGAGFNVNPGTLLCLDSAAPGLGHVCATSPTEQIVGIVQSQPLSAYSSPPYDVVAISGLTYTPCQFDGAATDGHYVIASATQAGDCHDAGATYPVGGVVLGRVVGSDTGSSNYHVMLFGPGQRGALGTLSGNTTVLATTSGSLTSGTCAQWDANGNATSSGSGCGGVTSNNAALFVSTADGVVANTTSETSIIGTGVGSKTTSANYFAAGTTLTMELTGYLGSTALDTLDVKIKAGSTVVGSTGAINYGALTTNVFRLTALITCRTAGASGTFIVNTILETAGATLAPAEARILKTTTVTLDTTATLAWDITATWAGASAPSATDTITGTNFVMFTPGTGMADPGANGVMRRTALNTTSASEISGDGTTSGSNVLTLKNTGTAGTYDTVTTDAQGRVSSGVNYTSLSYTNMTPGTTASTITLNSLTTRNVARINIPIGMTVNQLSVQFSTVTTAGTLKVCLYTADGATKAIDLTLTPVNAAVVSASASAIPLTPGGYYFVAGCATTCNLLMQGGNAPIALLGASTPSGKQPWAGTVTHASGVCDSALGTVTAGSVTAPGLRMDN